MKRLSILTLILLEGVTLLFAAAGPGPALSSDSDSDTAITLYDVFETADSSERVQFMYDWLDQNGGDIKAATDDIIGLIYELMRNENRSYALRQSWLDAIGQAYERYIKEQHEVEPLGDEEKGAYRMLKKALSAAQAYLHAFNAYATYGDHALDILYHLPRQTLTHDDVFHVISDTIFADDNAASDDEQAVSDDLGSDNEL